MTLLKSASEKSYLRVDHPSYPRIVRILPSTKKLKIFMITMILARSKRAVIITMTLPGTIKWDRNRMIIPLSNCRTIHNLFFLVHPLSFINFAINWFNITWRFFKTSFRAYSLSIIEFLILTLQIIINEIRYE